MAFECQESTKICFLKNSVNLIDNPFGEVVESNQFESYTDHQASIFDSKSVSKGKQVVNPEPTSENYKKKGSSSSNSLKLLLYNDSNCCRSITDLPAALISEILKCLDPKELGVVSCVSTILHGLASEHRVWKEFYCKRWGLPMVTIPAFREEKSWKELYVEREFRSKIFMGRYSIDIMYGHTEPVRTVFLLASAKLVFTSGYDSIVRMWDMEDGLSIASSRPLGCTIRAVAADTKLLVAGGDGFIHCWKAVEGLSCLFNLKSFQNDNTEFRLWEHEGPITCLALDLTKMYSGSWDNTVRVWDRSLMKCLQVLRHSDWVWSLSPHDTTVASTAGSGVHVWDTNSGTRIALIQNAHVGNTYSLVRSHTGDLLFTGGEDGAIHMFDISSCGLGSDAVKVATWIPHNGPVNSLAFEFPWIVSASNDGKMSLIDVRKLLRDCTPSSKKNASRVKNRNAGQKSVEPPQRMLHGFGCNLYSVDIGGDRIVCGGEEGAVRIWNFSQALDIERRVRALRGIRLENRMRRRKLQVDMNGKASRGGSDQCSVVANKNPINGVWPNKRGVSGKLKA